MTEEPLSAEYVRKVAKLARLDLTDDQAARYRGQLSAILGYVRKFDALDLDAVEPMTSPLDSQAPLRPDEPGPALGADVVMALAPVKRPPFIEVPKVLGDAGGGAA